MSRRAPTHDSLANPGGRQKIALELDRRKGLCVVDIRSATNRCACVRQGNDSGREEVASPGNEVLRYIDMANDEFGCCVVEYTPKLSGH
jgi:hypothetical protein